jgi:1,4-alpha-glucan branching enzyme
MWRRSFMEKLHLVFHKWEPQADDIGVLAAAIAGLTTRDVIYSESYREAMEGRFPRYPASYTRRQRAALAATIVLTAPGIPMLFQRQEDLAKGLWSHQTRDDWTEGDAEMRELYKTLIRLRTTEPSLVALRGEAVATGTGGKVLWIQRHSERDDAMIVLNFDSSTTAATFPIPRPAEWIVRFDSSSADLGAGRENAPLQATGSITLDMAPYSAAILSPRESRQPERRRAPRSMPAV